VTNPSFGVNWELVSDRKEQELRRIIRGRTKVLPGVMTWLERNQTAGAAQAVFLEAPVASDNPPPVALWLRMRWWGEAAGHAGMKGIAVTTTNPPEALSAADVVIIAWTGFHPMHARDY
jgi:hypothetical protein